MVISTYHINNVLRVYGDQLRHNRVSGRLKSQNARSPDKIQISTEAKRKAIVDKIASKIVDRITQHGPNSEVEKEVFEKLQNEYGANLTITKNSPHELIFKEIDENGETVNSLSIDDSKFLSYKLKEITKETVTENML